MVCGEQTRPSVAKYHGPLSDMDSEIILQQTRVAQGYEYFLRFIKRFPDVVSLAAASEDEVMKYWQGLGYYSRARNLHAAAKSMKGTFPKSYAEVRALKGVGDYTAAAICSSVFTRRMFSPRSHLGSSVMGWLSHPCSYSSGRRRRVRSRLLSPRQA